MAIPLAGLALPAQVRRKVRAGLALLGGGTGAVYGWKEL